MEFRSFVSRETVGNDRTSKMVWNRAATARGERLRFEKMFVLPTLREIRQRFEKHSILQGGHVAGIDVMYLYTEEGLPTDKMYIEVLVYEHVDQNLFPPEDRIPECIEGMPVHFQLTGPATIE